MRWRKKWADSWEQVKYCSGACRKRGVSSQDLALEQAIMELLARAKSGASICPSEAARRLRPEGDGWRSLMEPARMAARRLVARGELEITQGGLVVDPSTAKGPIRLREPLS